MSGTNGGFGFKMRMIAIVAVDQNWGIGMNGELLARIPEDQRDVFRKETLGFPVVYGRKTLLTFPEEKLLPKRLNVILSRNPDFVKEGAVVLHSETELRVFLECGTSADGDCASSSEKVFLIGGDEVYRSFLHLCDWAIVTKIHHSFAADAWFPNLDGLEEWELTEESDVVESVTGYSFSICHYSRQVPAN